MLSEEENTQNGRLVAAWATPLAILLGSLAYINAPESPNTPSKASSPSKAIAAANAEFEAGIEAATPEPATSTDTETRSEIEPPSIDTTAELDSEPADDEPSSSSTELEDIAGTDASTASTSATQIDAGSGEAEVPTEVTTEIATLEDEPVIGDLATDSTAADIAEVAEVASTDADSSTDLDVVGDSLDTGSESDLSMDVASTSASSIEEVVSAAEGDLSEVAISAPDSSDDITTAIAELDSSAETASTESLANSIDQVASAVPEEIASIDTDGAFNVADTDVPSAPAAGSFETAVADDASLPDPPPAVGSTVIAIPSTPAAYVGEVVESPTDADVADISPATTQDELAASTVPDADALDSDILEAGDDSSQQDSVSDPVPTVPVSETSEESIADVDVKESGSSETLTTTQAQPASNPSTDDEEKDAEENNAAEKDQKPFLGVGIRKSGTTRVTTLYGGSTAAKMGVMIGDDLISVNGKTVTDVESLRKALTSTKVGQPIIMSIRRNGEVYKIGPTPIGTRD